MASTAVLKTEIAEANRGSTLGLGYGGLRFGPEVALAFSQQYASCWPVKFNLCICIYIYIYIHIYIYIYLFIYLFIHTYMRTSVLPVACLYGHTFVCV